MGHDFRLVAYDEDYDTIEEIHITAEEYVAAKQQIMKMRGVANLPNSAMLESAAAGV